MGEVTQGYYEVDLERFLGMRILKLNVVHLSQVTFNATVAKSRAVGRALLLQLI